MRIFFFFWKMEILLSALAFRPDVSGENGHRHRIFTRTLSRVEILKTSFHCTRVVKVEVFQVQETTRYSKWRECVT